MAKDFSGTWETNTTYRSDRDKFLLGNEEFHPTVYFDTVGVATVGTGIALMTSSGALNHENLKVLSDVLGKDSAHYKAISTLAEKASTAITGTPEPAYPIAHGKFLRNPDNFAETKRGKALDAVFNFDGDWEPTKDGVTLPDKEARMADTKVIDAREKILDSHLHKLGVDPSSLTERQRVVLVDAIYQGHAAKADNAIKIIKDGGDELAVYAALYDKKYSNRTDARGNYLTEGRIPHYSELKAAEDLAHAKDKNSTNVKASPESAPAGIQRFMTSVGKGDSLPALNSILHTDNALNSKPESAIHLQESATEKSKTPAAPERAAAGQANEAHNPVENGESHAEESPPSQAPGI